MWNIKKERNFRKRVPNENRRTQMKKRNKRTKRKEL
jgi:hypothetical protein